MFRKKGIVLVLIVSLLLCACGAKTEPKVFKVEELSLTLDTGYKEVEMEGFTGGFQSTGKQAIVMVLREDKSLFNGRINTLDEYVQAVKYANISDGRTITEVKKDNNGIPYIEYNYTNKVEYRYYSAMYESDKAFWLVSFATLANKYDSLADTFASYARSVQFD